MSFTRSGGVAPAFSFPIGVGTFTDVNASNAVFTSNVYSSFYSGDGGLLTNVTASIPSTFANLVVSNSVTTTNVFATIYRGDGGLLSNITGSVTGNTLSNLNASNLAFGIVPSALIYGNTLSNVQFSNVSGFQSNTSSNLNASNLAFGVVSSARIYGNLISNINSSNLTQPFTNLVISNTITTTNISAAGFTSNASNTVFNYSTLTVPFASVTTLNVLSTANVNSLAATTINISSTSNLGQVVSSGQIVATGKTGVGVCPPIVYRQGGSATAWNTPGTSTSTFAITSGVVQMQCGANIMTGTTQFITFPVAYTNNPTVLVTSYGNSGNIWVAQILSTSFQVAANTAQQFEWLSIGV